MSGRVFMAIAYVFSMLLTWWPSRGAATVPVAEAPRTWHLQEPASRRR